MIQFKGHEKTDFLLAIIFFFIGFGSAWVFYGYRNIKTQRQKVAPAAQTTFKLAPPSEAVSGVFSNVRGKIYKKGRGAETFILCDDKSDIIKGESLKSDPDSSVDILFESFGKVSLAPGSQLNLTNLSPKNFIITQEQGSVSYENINDNHTISVRAGKVLYQLNKGQASIDYDFEDNEVTVEQISGSGKAAWVDEQNETKVRELLEKDKFVL